MNDAEPSSFPTTEWTQVIAVIQGANADAALAALDAFCRSYWPAVYKFFRRRGYPHEQAEEYTQEFFASRVLRSDGFLVSADRKEGRFRSFLSHVLWRFLQDEWKANRTARRGGLAPHLPLDELPASNEPADSQSFSKFGTDWDTSLALQIIEKSAERSTHSKYLLAHLRGELSQRECARELGLSEGAFKLAYFRFRERLAEDLWDEVAKLVPPNETEVRAEIRYLISLFAHDRP